MYLDLNPLVKKFLQPLQRISKTLQPDKIPNSFVKFSDENCLQLKKLEVVDTSSRSAEYKKINKKVGSKHLTHLRYPNRFVHQCGHSHVAYPGITPENSNHTRGQCQHLPSFPLPRLL